MKTTLPFFAPQLYIQSGITNINFYTKAFDAVIMRQFLNDDGSIHVAELSINGAIFHLHEEKPQSGTVSPKSSGNTTANIGLFVTDVDACVQKAIAAGAIVLSEPQDYDYGYRQATLKDPFGHHWLIEMEI